MKKLVPRGHGLRWACTDASAYCQGIANLRHLKCLFTILIVSTLRPVNITICMERDILKVSEDPVSDPYFDK